MGAQASQCKQNWRFSLNADVDYKGCEFEWTHQLILYKRTPEITSE